jgi:hypothetical protein
MAIVVAAIIEAAATNVVALAAIACAITSVAPVGVLVGGLSSGLVSVLDVKRSADALTLLQPQSR